MILINLDRYLLRFLFLPLRQPNLQDAVFVFGADAALVHRSRNAERAQKPSARPFVPVFRLFNVSGSFDDQPVVVNVELERIAVTFENEVRAPTRYDSSSRGPIWVPPEGAVTKRSGGAQPWRPSTDSASMFVTHPILVNLWIRALLARGRAAEVPDVLATQLTVCRTFTWPRA